MEALIDGIAVGLLDSFSANMSVGSEQAEVEPISTRPTKP